MVTLMIMNPDNFCGCVRLDGDVVPHAELDWNGVDDLEDGGVMIGLK